MPSLGEDITAARQAGGSDEHLLNAYKAFDPAKADDIDAALKSGEAPGHVLDALAAYDAQYGDHIENKGVLGKTGGALQEGVATELTGLGNTAKQTIGEGVVSSTLSNLGHAAAPTDYQSASEGLGDTHKAIGDRAGYIPRAMVEGAPGLATDIAAGAVGARAGGALGLLGGPLAEFTVPAGAAIGGIAGFGGSYLLRNYGNDTQRAAQARTGDANATPNTEDKERALAAGAASALLSRVGVTKALGSGVAEAGASALLPGIRALGKAAAIDGGTSVASDAVNTTLLDRKDPTDDPSGLALSAVQGAAAGTGLRAVTAAGDLNNRIKFRDIDPVHGDALASLYEGSDFTTPAKAYQAMKAVDTRLGVHADHWDERTQPQIDALEEASGNKDDTGLVLKGVRQTLADGGVVDPLTMETLRQRLGDYHEGDNLVSTLNLQNTQNRVKTVGNFRDGRGGEGTFGGGIADTGFVKKYLSPVDGLGKYGPRAALAEVGLAHLAPALSLDPTIAGALATAQVGVHLGAKAVDGVLRNTNPLAEFSRRFGFGDTDTPDAKPSFDQHDAVGQGLASSVADLAKRTALTDRATQRNAVAEQAKADALAEARARLRTLETMRAQDDTSEPANDGGLRHVRVGDQVVSFDPRTVGNPDRYAASVARRMRDRMDVVRDAKEVLPEEHHNVLDTLHTELNHNSTVGHGGAYDRVEEAVNKLPAAFQGLVLDKLNQAKLWASYVK